MLLWSIWHRSDFTFRFTVRFDRRLAHQVLWRWSGLWWHLCFLFDSFYSIMRRYDGASHYPIPSVNRAGAGIDPIKFGLLWSSVDLSVLRWSDVILYWTWHHYESALLFIIRSTVAHRVLRSSIWHFDTASHLSNWTVLFFSEFGPMIWVAVVLCRFSMATMMHLVSIFELVLLYRLLHRILCLDALALETVFLFDDESLHIFKSLFR